MSSQSLKRFTTSPRILAFSGTLFLALGIVSTKEKKSEKKEAQY